MNQYYSILAQQPLIKLLILSRNLITYFSASYKNLVIRTINKNYPPEDFFVPSIFYFFLYLPPATMLLMSSLEPLGGCWPRVGASSSRVSTNSSSHMSSSRSPGDTLGTRITTMEGRGEKGGVDE